MYQPTISSAEARTLLEHGAQLVELPLLRWRWLWDCRIHTDAQTRAGISPVSLHPLVINSGKKKA